MFDYAKTLNEITKNKTRLYAAILVSLLFIAFIIGTFTQTNLQRCEHLIFGTERQSCVLYLATSTNNDTMCSLLQNSNMSDLCHMTIAENLKSISICSEIKASGETLYECISTISIAEENASLCKSLDGTYYNKCVMSVATNSLDAKTCSLLNDSFNQTCSYYVAMLSAAATHNNSYCNTIPNATNRSIVTGVLSNASRIYRNSTAIASLGSVYLTSNSTTMLALCNMLAANSTASSTCTSGNATQCTYNASGLSAGSPFFENYSHILSLCPITNASSLCQQFRSAYNAISSGNVSECSQATGGFSYLCYSTFAIKYNNSSYCNDIANSSQRSLCASSFTRQNSTG